MKKRHYILYDERALNDTDDAQIFEAGITSLFEAKRAAESHGGAVCYSYAQKGRELLDERFEFWGRYDENEQYITSPPNP